MSMSTSQHGATLTKSDAGAESLAQQAVRVIEDPVGSAIAGLVTPAAAFGLVLSGMYGLALIH